MDKQINDILISMQKGEIDIGEAKSKLLILLNKELMVTDALFRERDKLLDAIPKCPQHGKCVPHALEWIKKMKCKEIE